MKRIGFWLLSTVSGLVLLFGYHTSTSSQLPASTEAPFASGGTTSASRTASAAGPGSGSGAGGGSGGSTGSRSSSSSGTAPATTTVTGDTIQTQWGPVQVGLVMKGATISKVTVLQYPDGNPHDAEINAQALPILIQETQSAQSAHIDMVSGATYTSGGYIQSLQSALDKVHA